MDELPGSGPQYLSQSRNLQLYNQSNIVNTVVVFDLLICKS